MKEFFKNFFTINCVQGFSTGQISGFFKGLKDYQSHLEKRRTRTFCWINEINWKQWLKDVVILGLMESKRLRS